MNKGLTIAIVKELFNHAIKRLGFLTIALIAQAAEAKDFTKSFGNWTYYSYGNKYARHCFIYTQPLRERGEFDQGRHIPYLYIKKRGAREFSLGVSPGYEQNIGKAAILKVNNRAYALTIVLPDYSWTFSSTQDVNLIDEMLTASKFFTVYTHGADGSAALDYYSLKGFVHALKQLDKCRAKHYKP
jgi:hypothetical protein